MNLPEIKKAYRTKPPKIQRFLGTYKVIPPIMVEYDPENRQRKPNYWYTLLNILDDSLYHFVYCSKHRLKPRHIYYGEIREYGIFWRFTKKKIVDNDENIV